jgi:hypothetical protein
MLRAQPVLDAGDAQDENLGAAGGIGKIGNLQDKSGAGPEDRPALFSLYRYRAIHERKRTQLPLRMCTTNVG